MNINVSLNKTLSTFITDRVKIGGYSNISEYIRDLLRHDLKLTHHDHDDNSYPYDYEYIERLGQEALAEHRAGETKPLSTLADLLS